MRFERSIEIDAPNERVWDVLSDLEAWPLRIATVDVVELLTPAPIGRGSRVRLLQPRLPEGTWEVTTWDPPSYFEWTQKESGVMSVAGHRVEALGDGQARLTLTLDMRGVLIPIIGRFYKDLTNRYMTLEAEGMKRPPKRPDRHSPLRKVHPYDPVWFGDAARSEHPRRVRRLHGGAPAAPS